MNIFEPIKVGDKVKADGDIGTVVAIKNEIYYIVKFDNSPNIAYERYEIEKIGVNNE
jgi:hypothetical protein